MALPGCPYQGALFDQGEPDAGHTVTLDVYPEGAIAFQTEDKRGKAKR